ATRHPPGGWGREICIPALVRRILIAAILLSAVGPAPAQELLDQLAGLLNRGKLNVEVDLQPGRAAASPQWTLQVVGNPKAKLIAEADEGRVGCVDIDVTGGELIVSGKGLRPSLTIEGIRFEEGKGISEARFRGRGVWRPIVAVFRTLARPALRRLDVPTDIGSILRGEILTSEKSTGAPNTAFLDLVREVHINDTEFEAFAGYPLQFGGLVDLETAISGKPVRAAIVNGTFRPPRDFEVDGTIDGEIENGVVAFVGSRCTFSHGQLERGAFRVSSKDGQPETSFSAGVLGLDLTWGQFRWPGGPKVGVEAPSRFAVRNLRVRSDGSYSGTVDASLIGKVGSIDRAGMMVAADDVQLHTQGARVVDGKATGDVRLDFQYRLNHTLVVHYPVEQLGDRHVPLLFQGAFAADLHFEDAGSGDEGVVTGKYQFTVPWPPVEQAAFEVLRARWRQDIAPVIHKVDFVIEPRHFGPCGRECFLLDLVVTAQKPKAKGYLFQQICDTQGKADVVVDTPSRSLLLRNVRVQPRCQGVIGAVVNFLAPFLTKTYTDVTLMQMPANLPFTIESVGSGADSIVIAGKVAWAMKSAEISP
ncbi:MAG TPA: hypothetical protein VKL19_13270, partial [Thermoanaerobaculia bacterium]|nr:hypothetical protein [Thermoanaerobaculia bacterium]